MSGIDDYFARMMPDAEAWIREMADDPFGVAGDVPPGYFRPVGEPFTVRKLSAVIEVPEELLMVYGLIPDTRPKPPPPTWRQRLRRKRDAWRERTARRAYRIVAGYWPDNGEDDW